MSTISMSTMSMSGRLRGLRGEEKDGTEEEAIFITCNLASESESDRSKVLINSAPVSDYFYHLQFGN